MFWGLSGYFLTACIFWTGQRICSITWCFLGERIFLVTDIFDGGKKGVGFGLEFFKVF